MTTHFATPEVALRNACLALEGRSDKWSACRSLQAFIKNKVRQPYSKGYEQVVLKYLELCVNLDKALFAKEGLYHYRSNCQRTNPKCFEDVIKAYLKMAEDKAKTAKEESEKRKRVLDTNALNNIQTPEIVLLHAVSGEDARDRIDHDLVAPCMRFLMDSYRHCLDLTNCKSERLYHEITQQAFKSCLQYTCKDEFQQLCGSLRFRANHLRNHDPSTEIKLDSSESQSMLLQMRLSKLDTAISMELWEEAFKSAEDLQSVFAISVPHPKLIADYYKKMSTAFWKCGDVLLHACALHRHHTVSVQRRKNLTQEEMQKMSSRVLLATLSIPVTPERTDSFASFLGTDGIEEKRQKLANILGLSSLPTRQSLIDSMMSSDMQQYVAPELKELFSWLELEVHPLKLSASMINVLKWTERETDLQQYMPHLQSNTVIRLLQQVSQFYQSMEFNHLASMLPFLNTFQLERSIVEAVRCCNLQVRINHASRTLSFGPSSQDMLPEPAGNQLAAIHAALSKAIQIVDPESVRQKCESQRQQAIADYLNDSHKERERILARRRTIKDCDKQLGSLTVQKEKEEQDAKMQRVREAEEEERQRQEVSKAEEEERRLQEVRDRKEQRILQERKQVEEKILRDKVERMKKTELGARALKHVDVEAVKDLDEDFLVAQHVKQLEKEKKMLEDRLKKQWKKVDCLERAKHQVEVPLLQKARKEQRENDEEMWKLQEEERIRNLKAMHEKNLETKRRLSRMTDDANDVRSGIASSRRLIYEGKLKDLNERMAEERTKRLEERKIQRKAARRKAFHQQKEEEARRIKEEEQQRIEREQREEEDRRSRERLRKLEEQAKTQRARLQEIEERERRREEERSSRSSPSGAAAARAWRRGEARGDANAERGGSASGHDRGSPHEFDNRPGGWRDRGSPRGFDKDHRAGGWRDRSSPRRFDKDDRLGGWRDRAQANEGGSDSRQRHIPQRDNSGFWRRGGGTDDANQQPSWRRDNRHSTAINS